MSTPVRFSVPIGAALLAGAIVVSPAIASAATLSVSEKGVQIEATGLGSSTLEFPTLTPKQGAPTHKIVEKAIDGKTATVKYDGGGQIVVDVSDSSQVTYKFSNLPDDIRGYEVKMEVQLGQGPNRKWKMDEATGDFPAEKPAKPHLFQGNAKTFTIINYENRSISFAVPDYSYQQLTDAREWGWSAFFWQVNAPYNKDWKAASIKINDGTAGELKKVTLVDRFGQSTQSDWPNKVKSEEEIKADVEAEKAYYASFNPPATDKYGGLPGSKEKLGLKATGFFHVEKKNNRWLLVNPEGNAFFHLGICGFGPTDDYTTVKGREQIYEWLPSIQGTYNTAFKSDQGSGVISFQLANMIRKYGEPYSPDAYTTRMIDRVRKWGFNSVGAFSPATGSAAAKAANFPYVSSLPLSQWGAGTKDIPGITNTWDPFDESNRQKVEASFAKGIAARADDPLLIGYFLTNEPLYEDIGKVIPGLKGNQAAKRRLAQMLAEKYKTIEAFNAAWQTNIPGLDALADTALPVKTKAAYDDVHDFTGLFLDEYFRFVAETFHKYDKNHLLIGNRLQSGTINSEQLCGIMGKYLDVISFNYYTYGLDKSFLNRIHKWTGDKPMMLTEFYWSSPKDSGMSSRQDLTTQQERGLAYRNYVEQAAAMDYIVGIEWFTLVDQATTGRWFSGFNGEAGNTGLISVADRPWKPAVAEMAKTNYDIYKVWLGEKKPFVYDDPRFTQAAGGKKTMTISRATGPIKIDGTAENWPGVPAERISSARMVAGNDPNGFEASYKMCWDDTNLYILANIVDPSPMKNKQTGGNLWNGDGLELFIGSEKTDDGGPLLFTDRQVLIGGGENGQIFFNHAPEQLPAQTAVVPGLDGKSYTIEAALPWAALAINPKVNQELLFDLAVNDSASGTGRTRQLMWNGVEKNSGDRTYWGKAKLVP